MKQTTSCGKRKAGAEAQVASPLPAAPGRLYLDIETFSSEDLSRAGIYRYAEAPDFQILLIGYFTERTDKYE